jgi:Dolichyl-phosphate-mannose-protein mannosyltransferase
MHLELFHVKENRILLVSLVIALFLGLTGIWWGWVEEWNPDQMGLQMLRSPSRNMLVPDNFLKPPFHSYLNLALSIMPIKALEKVIEAAIGSRLEFEPAILFWSRLIQLGLFLGCIALSYRITLNSSGKMAASIVALVIATSAGFMVHSHFLTTDVPVTFWMLLSFLFAQSIASYGRMRDYVTAGFLVGIATATKYNGLVMGIAIPIFHCFRNWKAGFWRLAFDSRLVTGVSMVVVGFVVANPYSILDFQRFSNDFIYNFTTYSFYDGFVAGTGYFLFLTTIPDLLGWPNALILATVLIGTLVSFKKLSPAQRACSAASLGFCILYFVKFGAVPRVEPRFVLPVVPLLLVAAAPFMAELMKRAQLLMVSVLSLGLAYSVASSAWVGYRFATDPRMAAQAWIASHVSHDSRIESSVYSPLWNKYPGIKVNDVRMPFVSGRARIFTEVFSGDSKMLNSLERHESDKGVGWYDKGALETRRPDFIAVDSEYFDRFLSDTEPASRLYPEVRSWFEKLLRGELGYEVVFDKSSERSPRWLYPQDIGFVDNQIIILKRKTTETAQ